MSKQVMKYSEVTITFDDNNAEIREALKKAGERGLQACAITARAHAMKNIQQNHSIDTEELLRGIGYEVDAEAQEAYIGTDVKHAIYVELGTGIYYPGGRRVPWNYQDSKGNWHRTTGQEAKPFLVPAARDHAAEYTSILIDSLKNA